METKVWAARLAVISVATALGSTAIASPEFHTYEGRDAIHEGQGGEKQVIGGIEFWENGEPPHRYQIMGAIYDRRMRTGIYGAIRMSNLNTDIAKAAKAAGGDAVILSNADDDVIGVSGGSSAFGTRYGAFGSAFVAPVKARVSRYIVVRYLPDASPAASAPAATSPEPAAPSPPPPPAPPAPARPPVSTAAPATSELPPLAQAPH